MNIAYVYPWDVVGDPAAPGRIAALGVDAVALAASYHSTRAATPLHPAHRVLDVPYSAFYLPVRPSAWGRLVPPNPTWTSPDAFLQARDALRAVGLPVHAWTILTHSSHLGAAHPDVVVRNAFGDAYPYALCPSHEDVAEYCERLVREIVSVGAPDGLILEACGPMGFGHQSVHEKTGGADWTSVHSALLSLCFCTACLPGYPDADELRARVRAAIDGPADTIGAPGTGAGRGPVEAEPVEAGSVEEALGEPAGAVREHRGRLASSLRARLVAAARELSPGLPIRTHASPDPWAAGPFATLPDADPSLDGLVGMCWGTQEEAASNLTRLSALSSPGGRLGAYALFLPPKPADEAQLAESFTAYAKAGADELHLYHVGLASAARLDTLARALRAVRS
ncbi:hypothetical protein GCM10010412_093890 [Nonomuraea recticatena]|uniref:Alanine-rich protein n=1 Tax=Nonomuraea recticatena TaxID=46178 RepID=A0ABP6FRJ3_9ACTN